MIRLFTFFVVFAGSCRFFLNLNQQTLSNESISIIKDIKNEIDISFYFSRPVLKSTIYGQEFNSLADKVKTLLQKIVNHNSKIRLAYSEPKAYSEKYLEGIAKGLKTLALKDNADLLFGVNFELRGEKKSSSLSFIDLGDEKNLERSIIKKLLIISKKRPNLYVFSGQSLFNSKSLKKKVFFKELYEWFDIKLLKGDEENLNFNTPIIIIDPTVIPEKILSFVKNKEVKVVLLWDPYQISKNQKKDFHIDSSFNTVLKSEDIQLVRDKVIFDKALAGKSFISNSLVQKSVPFFLSCKKNCLAQNNLDHFDRLDFIFPGTTRKTHGLSFFKTSGDSGLLSVGEVKNLNFHSDFSKSITPIFEKLSIVEKHGRFLLFNDIDFLSERFLGIRDGESFYFENDNLNLFLSLINKEVFKISDPFSIPSLRQDKSVFSFYDGISEKHQKDNQELLNTINKDIVIIQNKIVNLESSLLVTNNEQEKLKKTDALIAAKNGLRLKYQALKLIQYNSIHRIDSYKNFLKRINYLFLLTLFLLGLIVKNKVILFRNN